MQIPRGASVAAALILLSYYWAVVRLCPRIVLRHARPANDSVLQLTHVGDLAGRLSEVLSAVERAAQLHPCHPRCLEQALTSRALLRLSDVPAHVVIGVKSGNVVEAHAWVVAGTQSNDASRPGFVALTHLP